MKIFDGMKSRPLRDLYNDYVVEMQMDGLKPLPFDKWKAEQKKVNQD